MGPDKHGFFRRILEHGEISAIILKRQVAIGGSTRILPAVERRERLTI